MLCCGKRSQSIEKGWWFAAVWSWKSCIRIIQLEANPEKSTQQNIALLFLMIQLALNISGNATTISRLFLAFHFKIFLLFFSFLLFMSTLSRHRMGFLWVCGSCQGLSPFGYWSWFCTQFILDVIQQGRLYFLVLSSWFFTNIFWGTNCNVAGNYFSINFQSST